MKPILWTWFEVDALLAEAYKHGRRAVELARPLWTPAPAGRHRSGGRRVRSAPGTHRPSPGAGASLLGRVRARWDARVDRQVHELTGHLQGVESDQLIDPVRKAPVEATGWAARVYGQLRWVREAPRAAKLGWRARRRPVIVTRNPTWDDESPDWAT